MDATAHAKLMIGDLFLQLAAARAQADAVRDEPKKKDEAAPPSE